MFDLVIESRLSDADFHQRIEFLIDGFIPKQLITLLFAEGGSGKSWMAYAIAKYAASHHMDVVYLDYDNPIKVLAERQLEHKLINQFDNLYYVSSAKADLTSVQMIDHILAQSRGKILTHTLFIIDSLRDFCDVRNDGQSKDFMQKLKTLRELGATIVVLSHSNKDARNYEGSNNIYNSVDNMFSLSKIENSMTEIKYLLTMRKDRAGTGDCAYRLDTQTLTLYSIDPEEIKITSEDKEFIEGVTSVLTDQPGLNKKDLLEALGHDKRDKTANARLDRYTGKHWNATRKSNVYTYQLSVQS